MKCLASFFCGMVVAINLSGLVETSPNYEFAWWKVVVSCGVGVAFAYYEIKEVAP